MTCGLMSMVCILESLNRLKCTTLILQEALKHILSLQSHTEHKPVARNGTEGRGSRKRYFCRTPQNPNRYYKTCMPEPLILIFLYSTGFFQLKIFKSDKEKSLKGAYTISKDNFLGLERGEIRGSKSKKKGICTVYLGIILKGGKTICLQESTDSHEEGVPKAGELEKWRSAFLSHFFCGKLAVS